MASTPREMVQPEKMGGGKLFDLFDREQDLRRERREYLLIWLRREGGNGGEIFTDPEGFAEKAAAICDLIPREAGEKLKAIQFPRNKAGIGPGNPLEQLELEVQKRRDASFARDVVRLFPEAAAAARDAVPLGAMQHLVAGAWASGDGKLLAERLAEARTLFPAEWETLTLRTGGRVGEAREELWNRMAEELNAQRANDEWEEFAAQARLMATVFPEKKGALGLAEDPVRDALIVRRRSSVTFDANLAYLSDLR